MENRDKARGDSGESWGRCQVKISTAAFLIGLKEPTPEQRETLRLALQYPEIAYGFARLMVNKCWRMGYRHNAGKAWCFNRGWNSGRADPKDPYVRDVLAILKQLQSERKVVER